jgi:hypothetical protein
MVQATIDLKTGQTVTLYADDMLAALRIANAKYQGEARRMDFKTLEEEVEGNGGCGMGQDHDGHVRQPEDQAPAAASGREQHRLDLGDAADDGRPVQCWGDDLSYRKYPVYPEDAGR